jgi:hypothetical protein
MKYDIIFIASSLVAMLACNRPKQKKVAQHLDKRARLI